MNSYHVAVFPLSKRPQMTSRFDRNKKVVHEGQQCVSQMFLTHFDVFHDILLNRPLAAKTLLFYMIKKDNKKNEKKLLMVQSSNGYINPINQSACIIFFHKCL